MQVMDRTEFLTLGTTPMLEQYVRPHDKDFHKRQAMEACAYVKQLIKMFPEAATDMFQIRTFQGKYGIHREVAVFYKTQDEMELAFMICEEQPEFWNADAKNYLSEQGYFNYEYRKI